MKKRVAVITDATSGGYFFPLWHCYYGSLFGCEALNVVTYRGLASSFEGFALGELIEVPTVYDDEQRAPHISALVRKLLDRNEVVIRCDVDEFLVPAPLYRGTLRDYVETLELPYVTAIGLDLVEGEQDAPLDLKRPLSSQRPWCVETCSLSKTAIVTRQAPVEWAPGFHAASVMPRFDKLYLLHAKFADVKGRVAWFAKMRDQLPVGSTTYAYYDSGKAKVEGFAAHLNSLPRVEHVDPLSDATFRTRFLATVTRNAVNGIYQGDFATDRRQLRHGIEERF